MLELPGMEAQSDVRYANIAMFSHTFIDNSISIFCSYIKSLVSMFNSIKPETKEVIELDVLSSCGSSALLSVLFCIVVETPFTQYTRMF